MYLASSPQKNAATVTLQMTLGTLTMHCMGECVKCTEFIIRAADPLIIRLCLAKALQQMQHRSSVQAVRHHLQQGCGLYPLGFPLLQRRRGRLLVLLGAQVPGDSQVRRQGHRHVAAPPRSRGTAGRSAVRHRRGSMTSTAGCRMHGSGGGKPEPRPRRRRGRARRPGATPGGGRGPWSPGWPRPAWPAPGNTGRRSCRRRTRCCPRCTRCRRRRRR
mmetsp:Transcript_125596/g.355290  ORF Transcript_125596/g.355290 Transcript_125596/m.355290 type:complete len:217 (+) Transcript_125596:72-722(+)